MMNKEQALEMLDDLISSAYYAEQRDIDNANITSEKWYKDQYQKSDDQHVAWLDMRSWIEENLK